MAYSISPRPSLCCSFPCAWTPATVRRVLSFCLLAAAIAMLAPANARAAEPKPAAAKNDKAASPTKPTKAHKPQGDVFDLGEIVVLPTGGKKLLKDAPGTVTVITGDQIRAQATNITDVGEQLNTATGVHVTRYGGHGAAAGIRLRGTFPSHTLVLVDGRPVNAPSMGQANLSWLDADMVERIEVVRGPMSALYGGSAVGGVVNIITRRPPKKMTTKIGTAYGTYNTTISQIMHGATFGKFGYIIQGEIEETDGYRDNDEDRRKNVRALLSYDFEPVRLTVDVGYVESRTGAPGAKPPEDRQLWASPLDSYLSTGSATSRFDSIDARRWYFATRLEAEDWKVSAWRNDWTEHNTRTTPAFWPDPPNTYNKEFSSFGTDMNGLDAQYSFDLLPRNRFTVGGSYEEDHFNAYSRRYNCTTRGAGVATNRYKESRQTWAWFLQDEIDLDPVTLTLGVRRDTPDDFPAKTSWRGNAVWKIDDKTRLRAGYGRAYRPPTLNDMYWPTDTWAQGNPGLCPETSWAWEAGIEHEFGDFWLSRLTYFQQKIDKMIVWAPTGPVNNWGFNRWWPDNVNRGHLRGVEFENKFNVYKDMTFTAGAAVLVKRDQLTRISTTPYREAHRTLVNTPKYKFDFGYEWKNMLGFKGLRLNADAQYVSERTMYYGNREKRRSPYFLLNAKLAKVFKVGFSELEFFVSANNILDRKYATQFGSTYLDQDYPAMGQTFLLGMSVKF